MIDIVFFLGEKAELFELYAYPIHDEAVNSSDEMSHIYEKSRSYVF